MSFTEKRLVGPAELDNFFQVPPIYYTVPQGKSAIVKQMILSNRSASVVYATVIMGPDTPQTYNAPQFYDTPVQPNDTVIVNLSLVLNSGDIIAAYASSLYAIGLTISGVENDGPLNPNAAYIADDSITTPKIADSAVTTDKIAPFSVVNSKLDSASVTSDKTSFTDTNFAGTVTADLALIDGTSYPGISHAQMRIAPSSNNVGAGISMQATGSGSRAWSVISAGPGASQGAGSFLIYRDANDGTSTSLRISTSGQVSMPNNPRFLAVRSGDLAGYSAGGGQNNPIVFNSAPLNTGSHYNTSTGLFTAPVAGTYIFNAGSYQSGAVVQLWFVINGARERTFVLDSSTNANVASTGIVYLAANDTIGVVSWSNGATVTIIANSFHTYFRGALLG